MNLICGKVCNVAVGSVAAGRVPRMAVRQSRECGGIRVWNVCSPSVGRHITGKGGIADRNAATVLHKNALGMLDKPLKKENIVVTNAGDPDAMGDSSSDAAANQGPPTLFWRVFAALCYLVPWIDSISLGREIYRRFRNLLVLYLVPGPLAKVYFSSQFAPLIIFFVMFLSIVKNKKLHHFVRFNCMQAIMLDIVVMLMHIVKAYLPAEIKWSVISKFVDMFMWTTCMGTVVYAVFWTLRGYYADIPFVSESVYHQVALSEYA